MGTTRTQLFQAPRNHRCDVILLFATAAESLDRPHNRVDKGSHRKLRMSPKDIEQMGLAKLFGPGRPRREIQIFCARC
jgi:hypothetical protein